LHKREQFSICYVTDRRSLQTEAGDSRETALLRRIGMAARAGIDWVQIREPDLAARELAELARAAGQACAATSEENSTSVARGAAGGVADAIGGPTRIIVNDRFDVAWTAGAGGVHLGERSLPVRAVIQARKALRQAREALGQARQASGPPNFLVGVSCHSLAAVLEAAEGGADYVFFGPIFATPSKARCGAPQGTEKLAEVCKAASLPVIAIGGITAENAAACRECGAAGVAAIRLFQEGGDVTEIVARLRR
jgi:thiamine-phosphate pyrophosphorylase